MRRTPLGVPFGLLLLGVVGCRTQTGSPPPLPPPHPPVTAAGLGVSLGAGQTLGDPIVHENLAVYPVRAAVSAEVADYLTLDEALAKGVIEVRERSDASVNTVLVTNRAGMPIFLMAGEVILGGKQDRVVAKDTVVPAGKKDVEVPVFCVEPHRWEGETTAFKRSGLQASDAVRRAALVEEDQGRVWARVGEANASAEVSPETGAYRVGASESEVAKAAQAYVDALVPKLSADREAIGVVVAVDGKVVSADVYQSQALFRKLQTKLLAAHARDAATSSLQGHARPEAPARASAQQFLQDARKGGTVSRRQSGDAEMTRVEAERAVGFQTKAAAAPGAPPGETMLHENYYGRDRESRGDASHRGPD